MVWFCDIIVAYGEGDVKDAVVHQVPRRLVYPYQHKRSRSAPLGYSVSYGEIQNVVCAVHGHIGFPHDFCGGTGYLNGQPSFAFVISILIYQAKCIFYIAYPAKYYVALQQLQIHGVGVLGGDGASFAAVIMSGKLG